jgi:hypothetical protein
MRESDVHDLIRVTGDPDGAIADLHRQAFSEDAETASRARRCLAGVWNARVPTRWVTRDVWRVERFDCTGARIRDAAVAGSTFADVADQALELVGLEPGFPFDWEGRSAVLENDGERIVLTPIGLINELNPVDAAERYRGDEIDAYLEQSFEHGTLDQASAADCRKYLDLLHALDTVIPGMVS